MTEFYHATQQPLFVFSKICSLCGLEKVLDDFPRSNTKDGYDPRCKSCRADYHAQYRANHRPAQAEQIIKPGYKVCKSCNQELRIEEFPVRSGKPFSLCKNCDRERARRYAPVKKTRLMALQEGHKICNRCKQEKLFAAFHSLNGKPRSYCIECTRAMDRARHPIRKPRKTPVKPMPTKLHHKVCNTCFLEKPFEAFKKTSLFKDGHAGRCKQCDAELRANRTEEEKVRERAMARARYDMQREVIRERDRKRTKTDHHRQIRQIRDNRPENRRKINQRIDEWYKAHPSLKREHSRRRKAYKMAVPVEKVDYERILERDGWVCYICEQPIDPTIKKSPASLAFDHVIPLVPRPGNPQGTHTFENIRPVHKLCNSRKSNRPFDVLTPFDRRGLS